MCFFLYARQVFINGALLEATKGIIDGLLSTRWAVLKNAIVKAKVV